MINEEGSEICTIVRRTCRGRQPNRTRPAMLRKRKRVNYFRIGSMKTWLKEELGPWLRHKVRVVLLKQWKKPKTIYKNLMKLHRYLKSNIQTVRVLGVANARQGWYRRANLPIVNFLINPEILSTPNKKENRPGLVDPLAYYLRNT